MNKPLVIPSKSGKDVTTSLIIAEIFKKAHKNVIRDIESLDCSNDFRRLNFEPSTYLNSQNKSMPMYEITKDGFSFLVMGYTGAKAGQFKETFIQEFNKRESLLKNDDFIVSRALSILNERTRLLETQVQEKEKQLKIAAPKIEYHDTVLMSTGTIPTTLIAKELGMSAQMLNKTLNKMKVIYKVEGTWVLYQPYQNKGYASTKTHPYEDSKGDIKTSIQMVWTETGRKFIHAIIKGQKNLFKQ